MRERRFSSALRIPATCPECAGALALRDLAAAFRCPYCAAALLTFHEGPRRAALPFRIPAAGLAAEFPQMSGEAGAIFLPFEVASFRLWDLDDGRLTTSLVERSALALGPHASFGLQLPASEAWAADVRPFEPLRADGALVLAEEPGTRLLEDLRSAVLGGSGTRRATLVSRTILFWPFHLVPCGEGFLLVDGVSPREPLALTKDEGESLAEGQTAKVGPDIKPVSARCPVCRAGLPLEGPFCVRVCGPCGAVVAVTETGLVKLAREADVEGPPGMGGAADRMPVWRFRFTLTDPVDGAACHSLDALVARLGGSPGGEESDGLDVAAYLPEDPLEASSREGAGFLPGRLSAEHAAEIFRLALAAQLRTSVPSERFAQLVFEAPLELEVPRLVWKDGPGTRPAS